MSVFFISSRFSRILRVSIRHVPHLVFICLMRQSFAVSPITVCHLSARSGSFSRSLARYQLFTVRSRCSRSECGRTVKSKNCLLRISTRSAPASARSIKFNQRVRLNSNGNDCPQNNDFRRSRILVWSDVRRRIAIAVF